MTQTSAPQAPTSTDHARGKGVAVVTGGTAGVGRATVRELAEAGYDVAVLARGRAGLEATRAEVVAAGRRCVALPVDVADATAVDAAAEQVEAELGPIEVWVNNAFVGALGRFWDTSDADYRRMTDVTYFGQVNGTRAALRHMRPRDRGSVVNVSSALAYRSIPLQSAYCGAKHAIKGMTESVLTELRAEGSKVTVSLVTLPGVNTPQFGWNKNQLPSDPAPVPPLVQPEVAARAIRASAEQPQRNRWVGVGTVFTVLGGRLAPTFMDFYLGRTGIDSQQTDRDVRLPEAGIDDNLYAPKDQDEDAGAHGAFDDVARSLDPVLAVSMARSALRGALGIAAGPVVRRLG